jgi:hypothetical protein
VKGKGQDHPKRWQYWWISSFAGVLAGVSLVLLLLLVSSTRNSDFSYNLFLITPFLIGAVTALVGKCQFHLDTADVATAAVVSYIFPSVALLIFSYEGIICLIMAFPLYALATSISAGVTAAVIDLYRHRHVGLSFVIALPLVAVWQAQQPVTYTELVRVSETTIDASPNQIWPMLFELDQISVSQYNLLNLGFARPIRVSSAEPKVGAHRECVLTTGVMNETITEVVPERKLAFKILNTPASMKETTPFGEVHADHMSGYYECQTGQFELVPLADGRTKIIGTSHYRHKFGPALYWNLWTNLIVREVHHSVFDEINRRIEN